MVILGIDPGYRETGYGIICVEGDETKLIDSGHWKLFKEKNRLSAFYRQIQNLCDKHNVTHLSVENIFYSVNVQTTLKLGYIVGVSLCFAEMNGIPYTLIPPSEIKKVLLCNGAAKKIKLQEFINTTLASNVSNLHASDALAASLALSYKLAAESSL